MKPTLASSSAVNKSSHYQEYRSKTKSDLNCSGNLLSGLNDLDMQMKEYERLRGNRVSQSSIESLNLKEISNAKISAKESNLRKYNDEKSQRTFSNKLETIQECETTRKTSRKASNMTGSCILVSKTNQFAPKASFSKPTQSNPKLQDQKKQKIQSLKTKTKSLQQELLQAFSSNWSKKNLINKQFTLLFKVFD